MRKYEYKGLILFAIGCSLVGYLWFFQLGNGIVIGTIFGLLHYTILRQFYSIILSIREFRVGLFVIYFLGNLGIFAVPLYIGCVYPDFVNVFGAAFGLTIHNLYIYGSTLVQNLRK